VWIARVDVGERQLPVLGEQALGERDRVAIAPCSFTPTTICRNIALPPEVSPVTDRR
jgi:hypothetical protein